MKKIILFILFALFLKININAQAKPFAEKGAHWWYMWIPLGGFVNQFECTKDTTIMGKNCSSINATGFYHYSGTVFMYEDSEKVYYFDSIFKNFIEVADFSQKKGDSIYFKRQKQEVTLTVDSTGIKVINGINVRMIGYGVKVHDSTNKYIDQNSAIFLEGIGSNDWLLPFEINIRDSNIHIDLALQGLRCFQDSLLGHYRRVDVSRWQNCDTSFGSIVPTNELRPADLTIFPMPGRDYIHLKFTGLAGETNLAITDAQGRVVMRKNMRIDEEPRIDINSFAPGIYFVVINDENLHYSAKFIKQ